MILVTVGMQLGFDRLVKAMDELAPRLEMPVIAQTGKGAYQPRNLEVHTSIPPDRFEALIERSALLVSHAGIGTVLSAQRHAKPIVLLPRLARYGEHRNDHQLATVSQLGSRAGIHVASDETALQSAIAAALAKGGAPMSSDDAPDALQQAVRRFVGTGRI